MENKIKYYAGIGSRETPSTVLKQMTAIANHLSSHGWTLRSGGATGADSSFELGAKNKEIFYANDTTAKSMNVARRYHHHWHKCSLHAKKLHGRNTLQVLGQDLNTHVDFVVCWTKDGCECHDERTIKTGGTGTAISIASEYGIAVYNIHNNSSFQELCERFDMMHIYRMD